MPHSHSTSTSLALVAIALLACQGCGKSEKPLATAPATDAAKVTRIEPGPDVQKRLQRAMIEAKSGETIELAEGRYDLNATLSLDVADVTIRGAGHDKTILDFSRRQAGTGGEGLLVTTGPITLEDFAVEDARGDAIKITGADGVTFRRIRTEWTGGPDSQNGSYGIYPVQCSNVLVEHCVAIGASDAGIYVGQSENIIVRHNRTQRNVAGIEIENSLHADVYENHCSENSGGILVFALPNLPVKHGRHCRVFKNEIVDNNHPNFAPDGNIVALVPPGMGLMVMAYDDVEVFENEFRDNGTINIGIISYLTTEKKYDDPEYDPYAEGIAIHHNRFEGGGDRPAGKLGLMLGALVGGKFPDIAIDGVINERKLVDGALPPELGVSIHDNGDADFANLDLGNFQPLKGKLPKVNRDPAPHIEPRTALAPVELNRVRR